MNFMQRCPTMHEKAITSETVWSNMLFRCITTMQSKQPHQGQIIKIDDAMRGRKNNTARESIEKLFGIFNDLLMPIKDGK